jgi:nicotinate-nucleotide adenylyltransferase
VKAIGVLGGTFDPVHHGHLRVALELVDLLALDEVRLVPVGSPAHRDAPQASAAQRVRMLKAALGDVPGLAVDVRETERAGPSFTVDTLASMRADFADASLTLIIGMDQFQVLSHWHRWAEIPEFAHICVVHRPGASTTHSPEIAQLLLERQVTDPARLREALAGYVYMGNVPVLDISSTRIRALIGRRTTPRFLLTDNVLDIIKQERLYASRDC